MARKAHGIGELTETEKQPGYCPERFAKQIEGCRPEIRVDERGFKYTAYVKIKGKEKTAEVRKPKTRNKTAVLPQPKELTELPDLELVFN